MTANNSKLTPEARAALVQRYQESGKTQSEFCRDEGVTPHILAYAIQRTKEKAKTGIKRGPKEAMELIREWQREGSSISEFARKKGVLQSTMQNYVNKWRAGEYAGVSTNGHVPKKQGNFVRVGEPDVMEFEVGGVAVKVPSDIKKEHLKTILEALNG